jgi:hypothetical protein
VNHPDTDIADAIIAGIGGADNSTEQMAAVVTNLERAGFKIIPRLQYEALVAALEAARLLEVAEHFHANCEECEGEGEMEECGECFPLADDARLKRREAIVRAHGAGLVNDAALRAAGIETEG